MTETDSRLSIKEKLVAVDWEGPFTLEELVEHTSEEFDGADKWCLYAIHSDHPIYGANSLTYIGMTLAENISTRLEQHKWWDETVLVGCIYDFKSWEIYHNQTYEHAITKTQNKKKLIEAVEALLIYSLAPAYNSRNKKSAEIASNFRIFNTGVIGSIPSEISGFYNIEKGPDPEGVDGIAEGH